VDVTSVTRPATMRAAVFAAPGRLEIGSRPVPRMAAPTDVLIAVEACGICGTDVHILEDPPGHPGTPGSILGHELVGHVEEAGPEVRGVAVGDRVVLAPNLSCGSCAACKRGWTDHCEDFDTIGIFRDGGLAPYLVAPARACHRVSPELPRKIAALTEPLSCVYNGVRQARPLPGETAVVLGAGAIGLMFCALLKAAGCSRVAVSEPTAARREIARAVGADILLDPGSEDVVAAARDALGSYGADIVVDAVGSQFPAALELAAPQARLVLFGMNTRARGEIPQVEITRKELSVLGTYVGSGTFPDTIRILEEGVIDLEPIVSHWVPLDELPGALEDVRGGRAVKVVVDIAGSGW
jgi:threonine dehydrogenase-like Zn-dependent dehydrogenase